MIDQEIDSIVHSIGETVARLNSVRVLISESLVAPLEQKLLIETRLLYTKYIDIVLWSRELDREMRREVRAALVSAKNASAAQGGMQSEALARRVEEFDAFTEKQQKNLTHRHLHQVAIA